MWEAWGRQRDRKRAKKKCKNGDIKKNRCEEMWTIDLEFHIPVQYRKDG